LTYNDIKDRLGVPHSWNVIPLKRGTKNGFTINDKPLNWKGYSKDGVTEDDFNSWGVMNSDAYNWGLLTGEKSGIFVVDLDGKDGIDNFEAKAMVDIDSIDTVQSVSGSGVGRHLYFKYPKNKDIGNSASSLVEKVDVRGKGGFLVLPPSLHPSGNLYHWVTGKSPKDIEPMEAPAWLLRLIEVEKAPKTRGKTDEVPSDIEKLLEEGVGEGGRNDACARVAGYYFGQDLSFDEVMARCLEWNQKNRPPLPDEEVKTTVSSVEIKDSLNFINSKGAIRYDKLATHIIDTYHVVYSKDQKAPYYFVDGHYELDPFNETLNEVCAPLVGFGVMTDTKLKQLLTTIKAHKEIKVDDIEVDIHKILFQNGMLDLKTWEFRQPTYQDKVVLRVPHNYNPEAQCPQFLKYLDDLFDTEYHPVLQEFIGYSLTSHTKFQKALIIQGPGGNGKSVLVDVARCLVGSANSTALNLQQICGSEKKFAVASLRGKLLNVVGENPTRIQNELETLKSLITGDTIHGEFKGIQGFYFKPFAKYMFIMNELPKFNDSTIANYRRWLVIKSTTHVYGDDADREITERLCTEAEIEGIIAWAMGGLKRLYQQNNFTKSGEITANVEEMARGGNSVEGFIQECCTVQPGLDCTVGVLFKAYNQYCDELEVPKQYRTTLRKFTEKIIMAHPEITKPTNKERDGYHLYGITVDPTQFEM
jgi:putative DNA primase/helicase